LYRERTQPRTTSFANRSRQIATSCRDARVNFRAHLRSSDAARPLQKRAHVRNKPSLEKRKTTMSKKLKLSHETIRVLTADTIAGVVGGQASGSSGNLGTWRPQPAEQQRLEDLAKRGE
jgi:hypothetical protein